MCSGSHFSGLPKFYRDIFKYWKKLTCGEHKFTIYIHAKSMWYDNHIIIEGNTEKMYDKGMMFLSDVLNNDSRLLSRDGIADKFSFVPTFATVEPMQFIGNINYELTVDRNKISLFLF